MAFVLRARRQPVLRIAVGLLLAAGCSHPSSSMSGSGATPAASMSASAPNPDPRVGLKAGLMNAQEAVWNLRVLSRTQPSAKFVGITNSDLAFSGPYAIQGSYAGYQVWDISNPVHPSLKTAYYCPASQSDVSVYKNLLFVSGEGLTGRVDCGDQGVKDTVSKDRLRGLRIFDISDISNPKNVGNVQTCRGSHTHTAVVDPKDPDNVYIYISGSSRVRSPNELPGCSGAAPDQDPNSALFRIEVIKVPLAHPEQAAIVSSPRIFNDLTKPARHGESAVDKAENAKEIAAAKAKGEFTAVIFGDEVVLPSRFTQPMVDSVMKSHGGTTPTAADSAAVRAAIPAMVAKMVGPPPANPNAGPTQCHDITVYPAIGRAGGACEGYGLLLDISDPAHPQRLDAASDSNFSYWHSATFNNDGTKLLFSDEWGGGGQPKCRATDKKEWGADALFTIEHDKLVFHSYYKMPAPQTKFENCVAHNGSLVPIPGRDVMIQSWYQGGISLFDWTDIDHPREIAFFDRGPVDSTRMAQRRLVVRLLVQRCDGELRDLARTRHRGADAERVHLAERDRRGEVREVGLPQHAGPAEDRVAAELRALGRVRGSARALTRTVGGPHPGRCARRSRPRRGASGAARRDALTQLSTQIDADASGSSDSAKVQKLSASVKALAGAE